MENLLLTCFSAGQPMLCISVVAHTQGQVAQYIQNRKVDYHQLVTNGLYQGFRPGISLRAGPVGRAARRLIPGLILSLIPDLVLPAWLLSSIYCAGADTSSVSLPCYHGKALKPSMLFQKKTPFVTCPPRFNSSGCNRYS